MLAATTRIQELAISETEAHSLAERINAVQEHYNTVLDPKTEAWVMLAVTATFVYGPRLVAANHRMNREAKEGGTVIENPPQPKPEQGAHKPTSKKDGPVTPSDLYPPDQRGG